MTLHPFAAVGDLKKLIKNFTLMSLVETSKTANTPRGGGSASNRRTPASNAFGFAQNKKSHSGQMA
jgi:hypothetical protein